MNPWPMAEVTHSRGGKEIAPVAHRENGIVTVRLERKPIDVPSYFGLQSVGYLYQDFPEKYVRFL